MADWKRLVDVLCKKSDRWMIQAMDAKTRLLRITQAHRQNVDIHGGTSGYCIECELVWPCPTYRWATEDGLDINCTWDLKDCQFEEHDHDATRWNA